MKIRTFLPVLASLLAPAAWADAPPAPAPAQGTPPAAAAPASAAPSTVQGIAPAAGLPNILVSGVPEIPDALRRRVEQYLNARSAGLADVSDDGKQVLITTRFGDVSQLHAVELPMGARTQLTFTREPINSGRLLPGNPDIVFYLQDVGGGEFFQLYRMDRKTGKSELLTDGKSRHEIFTLSKNGKWLAYSGTGRNGKDTDVYVAPVENPKDAHRVTEAEGSWMPLEFSRDGSKLLVMQERAADDADLHVVDVKTGTRTQLTPKGGKGSLTAATFTADDKGVYFVTDRWGDFATLYRLDFAQAPATADAAPKALSASIHWNVDNLSLSPDGARLLLSANEDGYGRIYLLDTKTNALTKVAIPDGVLGSAGFPNKRSDQIFFSLDSPKGPRDIYSLDLRSKKTTQWTRSEVGGIDTSIFTAPELVHYPSTDGVSVPAFYYRPKNLTGKAPVVIFWHGGPEGQWEPNFSPLVQFLVTEMKMAVLLPNVRGSEGYGKAFRAMDDGVKREASLADIGATLDFIGKQPELDASRVGVYGGSYGGYMVLASVTFFPERIRAAVDVVGVSSLPTFLQNTQAYRRDLRRAEYGDERIPEVRKVQERISPLNSVDKIQAALFVQQGHNDPRVPQSEAEQIVKAVRGKGRDVWYALALDEGHGFGKKPNRDFMTTAMVMFFEKHLLGQATAPASK